MQYIKGGFSHTYAQESGSKFEVWQRGFTDHRIRDAHDFENHRRYIHDNPVAARLSETAEAFPWSSANGSLTMDDYLSG
jgi:putative transposase